MKCYYCNKDSILEICEICLKKSNPERTKKLWAENKKNSEELGEAYYPYVWDTFEKESKTDSKENFGFNMYCEGVRLGLDIIIPFLDDGLVEGANKKIKDMVNLRKKGKK